MAERQPHRHLHHHLARTRIRLLYSCGYPVELTGCSSLIQFQNLATEDYEKVTMHIEMAGNNFAFTADLSYYDQVGRDELRWCRRWRTACS